MKHVAVLTVAPLVAEALNCRQKPNKFEGSAVGCTTGAMDGRGSEGLAEARGRLVRGAFVGPRSVGRGVGRRVRVAVGGLVAPVTVGRGVLVGRRVRVTVGGFVAPGTVGWGVRRCVRRAVGVLVGRCVGGMDPFPCAMSTFAMKQLAGVAQGDEAKTCTRGKAGARLFEAMLVWTCAPPTHTVIVPAATVMRNVVQLCSGNVVVGATTLLVRPARPVYMSNCKRSPGSMPIIGRREPAMPK